MSDKQNPHAQQKLQSLRAVAEARLARAQPTEPAAQNSETLLHELRVHQIELEMQNEELLQAHMALEASRDRYLDLYEFAPIGYLTLTAEAQIAEINLTGARLLGMERKQLIPYRFARFVAEPDQERWYRLFHNMMGENAHGESHSFDLKFRNPDLWDFKSTLL